MTGKPQEALDPRGTTAPTVSAGRLKVLKFGGTSVGDAASILRVIEITRKAAVDGEVVVVVSAMSGVTNQLIAAGQHAVAGDLKKACGLLEGVRGQHEAASRLLLTEETARERYLAVKDALLDACLQWTKDAATRRALRPAEQDLIASLGERLSAPLVAAAMVARGIQAVPMEAMQLVVTDDQYGSANPLMEATRARCEVQLRPLLREHVIPVVTGFIGATENGSLTTLGRGGSDYSATILASALQAQEVTIWTDVDGIFTADPHEVPGATTIPEMSYQEASDLAHFGARVLHPRTLRPVVESAIPVWIRNTFAPNHEGTKITKPGPVVNGGVSAVSVIREAAMITLARSVETSVPDCFETILGSAADIHADVMMFSYLSLQDEFCMVVAASTAQATAESLRRKLSGCFEKDLVSVNEDVSVLTVVGQNLAEVKGIVKRTLSVLRDENIPVLATGQALSACNVSLIVPRQDIKAATLLAHRELKRGERAYGPSSTELLHETPEQNPHISEFNP